ncbi:response regulator, partial [Aquabacterium sp.]|uniref:response regulator n=1 Tax=Aquabacterium sp. TaxID=1872578 RepID=UPI0025C4F97D
GVPASGAPAQLDGLLDHAILIHGPLSPLRILHALDRVPHQRRPATQRTRLQGLRVLAAEDNPVNRLVLDQMLIHEGADVCFACDGVEALELLQARGEHTFDVVLCDIQMPLMDGYETTRAMAHIAPTLPVIGLTAHAFTAAREQAAAAGMVAYVTKPYMIDALVEAILQHARPHPPARQDQGALMAPAEGTGTAQAA